jgi:hypothetical protein
MFANKLGEFGLGSSYKGSKMGHMIASQILKQQGFQGQWSAGNEKFDSQQVFNEIQKQKY